MGSPHFEAILKNMQEVHDRKNRDYSSGEFGTVEEPGNHFSNFEHAGELISWFRHLEDPTELAFVALIGIKLARLAELTKPGRVANNESIRDTRAVDLPNYCVLWAAYCDARDERKKTLENLENLGKWDNKTSSLDKPTS